MVLRDLSDPLHWECPRCGAHATQPCMVVVAGGRLSGNYGTHIQRIRLALFFQYNPGHAYNREVWDFATKARE